MSSLQPLSTANHPVVMDKQRFFAESPQTSDRAVALASANARATTQAYSFLITNRLSIEQEFNQLLAVLSREDKDREDLWLYCYYCCTLLSTYYSKDHYNSPAQYNKYQAHAQTIEQCYKTGEFPTGPIKSLQSQLSDDLKNLLSTPLHLSSMRDWIGWGNINRLAFTFSRLTTQQLLVILQEKQWLTMLSRFLQIPLNIDEITARLNTPSAVFRVLSVGLFAARLAINTTLLLKHTFFPTHGEKETEASLRFYQELKKRHAVLLNDVVWASLNALTNYADFFKISAPLANTLLISGLVFDVALLAYRLHDAEQDYFAKRTQYTREKREAQTKLERLLAAEPTAASTHELKAAQRAVWCLDEQLSKLEIQMQAVRAAFSANIVAASLLACGYTSSLFFTLPAAVFVSYFVIVVGIALYFSADAYGKYEEKRLTQHQMTFLGAPKAIVQAKDDVQKAWNNFVGTMLKNTFGPLIFMGAVALSWEAAIIVTALYLVAEGYSYYMKSGSPPKKQEHVPDEASASPPRG